MRRDPTDDAPPRSTAVAVVERRGGMLIHGAIIARELGLPCVNGVPGVVGIIDDGDLVTVDGCLGVVTIEKNDDDSPHAPRTAAVGIRRQ